MNTWPARSPPGPGGRRGKRTTFAHQDPRKAWRDFVRLAMAASMGGVLVGDLSKARTACAAGDTAFPVRTPAARAGSNALLEIARTYLPATEGERELLAPLMLAAARYCDAVLDGDMASYAAHTRRIQGERDDD